MSWFRRKDEGEGARAEGVTSAVPDPAAPPDPHAASPASPSSTAPAAWRSSAPLPLVAQRSFSTLDPARFERDLTSWQSPANLRPLAHVVSADAPAGVLTDLTATLAAPTAEAGAGPESLPLPPPPAGSPGSSGSGTGAGVSVQRFAPPPGGAVPGGQRITPGPAASPTLPTPQGPSVEVPVAAPPPPMVSVAPPAQPMPVVEPDVVSLPVLALAPPRADTDLGVQRALSPDAATPDHAPQPPTLAASTEVPTIAADHVARDEPADEPGADAPATAAPSGHQWDPPQAGPAGLAPDAMGAPPAGLGAPALPRSSAGQPEPSQPEPSPSRERPVPTEPDSPAVTGPGPTGSINGSVTGPISRTADVPPPVAGPGPGLGLPTVSRDAADHSRPPSSWETPPGPPGYGSMDDGSLDDPVETPTLGADVLGSTDPGTDAATGTGDDEPALAGVQRSALDLPFAPLPGNQRGPERPMGVPTFSPAPRPIEPLTLVPAAPTPVTVARVAAIGPTTSPSPSPFAADVEAPLIGAHAGLATFIPDTAPTSTAAPSADAVTSPPEVPATVALFPAFTEAASFVPGPTGSPIPAAGGPARTSTAAPIQRLATIPSRPAPAPLPPVPAASGAPSAGDVAVASGLGAFAADGSVVFAPPPDETGGDRGFAGEDAGVPALQRSADDGISFGPGAGPASGPVDTTVTYVASSATPTVQLAAAGGAAGGSSETEMDELARRLYGRIRVHLRRELTLDRERSGSLIDMPR